MATQWVTAAQIMKQAGAADDSPSGPNAEWAGVCAAAVNEGMDKRLEGATYPSPPLPGELVLAARTAGVEAFKRREAVYGITGYVDLQGAAIRVSRDYLDAISPIIARYATPGIG